MTLHGRPGAQSLRAPKSLVSKDVFQRPCSETVVAYVVGETMMIESLRAALGAIEGVEERPSRFKDGPALWVAGKEIAHFDDDDVMEIRLECATFRTTPKATQQKHGWPSPGIVARRSRPE